MIANADGAMMSSRAGGAALDADGSATTDIAIAGWRLIFVFVTAALLMAWLTAPDLDKGSAWALQPNVSCPSLGKAGVRCVDRATTDTQSQGGPAVGKICVSAGRAGLICG